MKGRLKEDGETNVRKLEWKMNENGSGPVCVARTGEVIHQQWHWHE